MGAALVFALGLGDLMADIMLRVVTQAAVTLMLHLHFDISVLNMQLTFHSENGSFVGKKHTKKL